MPRNRFGVANSFTNSFMRGFSFVDDINRRKRTEAKLDEELKRRRTLEDAREGRAQEVHDLRVEEADRVKNERELGRQGDMAALDQSTNLDDVIHLAPFSTRLQDRIARERGEDELLAALDTVRDTAASQQTTTGGAGGDEPGGLSSQVLDAVPEGQSQLAPSRGTAGLQSVDLDDLSEFDSDAPDNLGGQFMENLEGAGNRLSGGLRGLSVGAANLVNRFTDNPPVESGANLGAEIGGNVMVPEGFTTEQEFASISDPREFEQARIRNEEILADIKSRGNLGDDASRLDQLREGTREMQAEARAEEFRVTKRYDDFLDPTVDSKFRQMAADDPEAAMTQYFNDRATLASASPNQAAAMDMQMQPVIQSVNQQYSAQLAESVIGTPEHRRAAIDMRNLQATQKQMYDDYSPSDAAGIDARGLPVGNSQLTQNFGNAVSDPNRPRPVNALPGREVTAASTQANRIQNNRRATDAQLRAAIKLHDVGLASKEQLMSLAMTGTWPDSTPAATLKAYKPGDVVYSQGADGSVNYAFTVPGGKNNGSGGRNRAGTGAGQNNQLTQAQIEQFVAGAHTVFSPDARGSEELVNDMVGAMLDDSDWIQENFDLRDPIAANRVGRSYAQAIRIADSEDSFVPNFIERWVGEAPTAQEIMRSPHMAARLATEHDIPMPLLPEQRFEGLNINNLRQELSIPGKYPQELMLAADPQSGIDDQTLLQIVRRYDYLTEGQ